MANVAINVSRNDVITPDFGKKTTKMSWNWRNKNPG